MGARVILRSAALILALAAGAAPWLVPTPLAAAAAKAPVSPLQIRVGQSNGFSRIEFHWDGNVVYSTRRDGDDLIVRFSRNADPDMSLLKVDPPVYLKTASLRRQGQILEVVLTLKPHIDFKAGQDSGAIFVNLFPQPASDRPQDQPGAAKVDPVPAGGVVHVEGDSASGQVLLRFPWKAPLGAAAFRRGDQVWLVFDAAAKIDFSKAPGATPLFRGMTAVSGPGWTGVRVTSPNETQVKAWAEGSTWTLALGPGVQQAAAPVSIERDPEITSPALRAGVPGATRVLWIDDPLVGDRVAVIPALSPTKGVAGRRGYVDFSLLPSAQGLALEPNASDLQVAVDGEWVKIGRPKGLALSTVASASAAKLKPQAMGLPQAAAMPGLIDYASWSRTGEGGFMGRYSQLQNVSADELNREANGDRGAGVAGRIALARFLVGSELNYEAIGVLNGLFRKHQELAGDPEFRGLRGAARAMAGRYKEAENDFSTPALSDDPASSLWRGYIAAKLNDWTTAIDAFSKGASAMNQFAPVWQSRFARAYAEAALTQNKFATASTEIALSIAQTNDPVEQLETRLIQARMIEAMGDAKHALPLYDAVARAPLDKVAVPALMHAAGLRMQLGQISPVKAAAIDEGLRFRWRGDRVELELTRTLGRLYLAQGHYREAMEVLRSMDSAHIDAPEMADIRSDEASTFRALFLDGRADGLEPVQALALFYDFKELTPVGSDGDLMVRKLARRLVDVDLLSQASELLKYQVENRLDGTARAQVAADLATLYLMDRKPEQAIEALNNTRTSVLPKPLQDQRRIIEARAWLDLNQADHALELVAKDNSTDADDIRAEVAWRSHDWPKVGPMLEKLLGERWKQAGPLSAEQEAMLLRAGVAYSLAGEEAGLDRLRGHFGGFIDSARQPDALRVALTGEVVNPPHIRDFARVAADTDVFAGWVDRMKKRFKDAPSPSSDKVASADSAAKG